MRLKDKRVLITGGARGIGRGIVTKFLQEGAKLYTFDLREKELQALIQECELAGSTLQGACVDISDEAALEQAFTVALDRLGGLDILINNAGIAVREPFTDIPLSNWDRILNVNVRAMFILSQLASRVMIRQGKGGSIVNMSSKNGLAGSTMLAHYNASKGAVQLLTQSMAAELAPYGIRVNAIAPGFIDTNLNQDLKKDGKEELVLSELVARTPMGRLGTIEEVANVFLFLASDESSYVTGTSILVDGGHLANASDF